jgi:uncharacterized protein YigE (DUF2233 family)
MNTLKRIAFLVILSVINLSLNINEQDPRIRSIVVNPTLENIRFYWKTDSNQIIGKFDKLNKLLQRKNETLVFSMNGGMFKSGRIHLGLYIEKGKVLNHLNNTKGKDGNFFLGQKGIFYITKKRKAGIIRSSEKIDLHSLEYATQSGPMLIVDGKVDMVFKKGSVNTCIRNGVGLLPNGNILFAISKQPINFYDFAKYFQLMGCKQALYLDGIISKMYEAEVQSIPEHTPFGVIIAVSKSTTSK